MLTRFRLAFPLAMAVLAGILVATLVATGDQRLGHLLSNTAWLALGTSALALPAGTLLAVLLFRTDLGGRRLVIVLLLMVLFLPLYLQAAGWDAGFGKLGWFSFSRGEPLLSGWRAAIWIHGLAAIPWVVLIVATGLHYVAGEFEELALLEAAAPQVVWHVTLRRSLPSVGVAALWISVMTAGEMTVTDLYQIRTYTEEVYIAIPLEDFVALGQQWRTAALTTAVLTLIALAATFYLAPPPPTASVRRPAAFRLGAARSPALLSVIALGVLVVGIPFLSLCFNAGVVVRQVDGAVVRNWEWTKLIAMIAAAPSRYSVEFGWTFLIGCLSATVSLLIAVPLAWIAVRKAWGAGLALSIAAFCLALPGPILGLALIRLLNQEGAVMGWLYDRSVLAPCLATIVRSLPLSILVSWHALRSIGGEVLEAAETDGVGAAGRLWRVAAPQRRAAFAAVWLAAFAISLGDLSATILVTPPGVTTVAIRVFGLLHAGVDDQVAGLCLTMSVVFLAISAGVLVTWSRISAERDG